jgi:sugar phosphate isomerase/epimerase
MQLGIFAKVVARSSLEDNLDAIGAYGFECVQYNMVCAGMPSLPDSIDDELCSRIRTAFMARGITMAAISGTFNIIDPDREKRQSEFRRLGVLAAACDKLGTSVITLCSGTRDPDNMWRRHPDNDTPEAWKEMIASMRQAVDIAEETGVIMAFEPEVNNVVDSAQKGRRLLDEIRSPNLKVVMDGANVFHKGDLQRMHDVLDDAFENLGGDIAIAHAKDLSHDGDAGNQAAGTGVLDYDYYLSLLQKNGFDGPLITHGLEEHKVDACVVFLKDKLARLN